MITDTETTPVENQISVLIAEDDYLISSMIHDILQQRGYCVVGIVEDGKKAVEATVKLKPDVILMDIKMPVLDGIKAASKIRECCPTPIVILSAYETPDLVQHAGNAGVSAYLVKPSSASEIYRAISLSISRYREMMTLDREKNKLRESLECVKKLSGLIPICASCKKIRIDTGDWQEIELFLSQTADVEFSHGLCPDCLEDYLPESTESRE